MLKRFLLKWSNKILRKPSLGEWILLAIVVTIIVIKLVSTPKPQDLDQEIWKNKYDYYDPQDHLKGSSN